MMSVLAAIAQLGERQTEDLKVPGSIPGGGIRLFSSFLKPKRNRFLHASYVYSCDVLTSIIRSHHLGYTRSHPNSEVKQG